MNFTRHIPYVTLLVGKIVRSRKKLNDKIKRTKKKQEEQK